MRTSTSLLCILLPSVVAAQSSHLIGLESSTPTVERTAGLPTGLSGLFQDPTLSPVTTGAFFSVYQTSYSSMRVFHGAVAFRWGPRWSLFFASTEVAGLFDSSLINQDPTLSTLRARAALGGLDATVSNRFGAASLGVGLAADENVGDVRTSTLARVHLRWHPVGSRVMSVAVHWSGIIGGNLAVAPGGRKQVDVVFTKEFPILRLSLAAGYFHGAHWRHSETVAGYGLATQYLVLSHLDLGLGVGRYHTAYGVTADEWQKSVSVGLLLSSFRVSVRYTGTAVGLGTGQGISMGYEPLLNPREGF